ncbi:MAG TPA: PAS domain S-box protein [Spirochaetota bacterium]|nr:PAS domain S-box protein [Spirochaetota bacterium]
MKGPEILIVEDELITVESIRDVLESRGYNIIGDVTNSDDALALLEKEEPDLILMDIRIKGNVDGIELARIVGERYRIPIIYLTAFADRKTVERAKMTESYGYIIKPFGEIELVTNIEIALYKHRLSRKMKEGEKRFRILFESMNDALYIHDGAGSFIDFNPSLERLTGYSRHELMAKHAGDLFADQKARKRLYAALESGGRVNDEPVMIVQKDGGAVRCLVSAYRTAGVSRGSATIHGVIRDVNEQWEAHRKLEEERLFTEAVIDSMPAIIYAVDREGRFARWNRKLEELSGLTGEMLRGASLLEMMSEKNRPLFTQKLDEGFSRGEVTMEVRLLLRGAGDERRNFRITGRRVEIGGKEYLVGAGVDITE